jgi:hypothetical protein
MHGSRERPIRGKPLVILSRARVNDHGGPDVDVFGAPFVGGLRDLFGCSVEHALRPECEIGFCGQRAGADGCGCCSFDGDEDNGRSISPSHVWVQSSLVQGGKPTSVRDCPAVERESPRCGGVGGTNFNAKPPHLSAGNGRRVLHGGLYPP